MNVPLTPVRFLRYAREQYPDNTAVVCGDQRFTYERLAARVGHLAGALHAGGIRSGDRVAFLTPNCHRLLEAYYGVLEAGAVLLPIDNRLHAHELIHILNDAAPSLLFLDPALVPLIDSIRGELPQLERFVLLDGAPPASWLDRQTYEELLADAEPYHPDIMQFDENALAELFYTSGTSDPPKGVMLTHRNVYLHALDAALAFNITTVDAHLHTIPLFHANGWGAAHILTLMGSKHVMLREFDPAAVFRLIARERVRACLLDPQMAAALLRAPERHECELGSLRWIAIGGSPSSPALVREVNQKLGCDCFSGYGLTETSPVLALSRSRPGVQWKGGEHFERQAMTGYAVPGVEIRIVDAQQADVPRDGNTVGEIITRGDGVMQGYWRQDGMTAEVIEGGWFHTGDMATIDAHGYISIVDRKKDIIFSGGENISSLESEKALRAHPDVADAAVISVPDEERGQIPTALVVLKPGKEVDKAELLAFCQARLGTNKAPRSVEFVPELPKNATGKILKRELRKQYRGGQDVLEAATA